MILITDRTKEDVLLGNEKGSYSAADLNRVEAAVGNLALIANTIIPVAQPSTKTDWTFPELFSSDSWPTQSQMARYLDNVMSLCQSVGVAVDLPESMEYLTWDGANKIEKALQEVQDFVIKNYKGLQYSGEFYAGEENVL